MDVREKAKNDKRLIDANALIAEYDRVHIGEPGKARKLMEDAPTVDAVSTVRHAKWVDNHCTACGMMPMGDEMWKKYDCDPPLFDRFMDYCPSCGAKMDGGDD